MVAEKSVDVFRQRQRPTAAVSFKQTSDIYMKSTQNEKISMAFVSLIALTDR